MDTETYIFGYGSLMYPSGINGKGLRYKYKWEDLSSSMLLDYRRGMFAHYIYNYYGIMESKNSMINGVVFKIHSDRDFRVLIDNEGASKRFENTPDGVMYKLENVTNNIYPTFSGRKVLTFTSLIDKSHCGAPSEDYIRKVYKGILPWGDNFKDTFLKTGGLKPSGFLYGILHTHKIARALRFLRRNIK